MIWINYVKVLGLQAYGQRDPLVEFKFMGFEMFDEMIKCDS